MLETESGSVLTQPVDDTLDTGCDAPAGLGSFIEGLVCGGKKVGIWGLGYLGYHNLIDMLTHRLDCLVTDDDPERLARVSSSEFVGEVMQNHYGFGSFQRTSGFGQVKAYPPSQLASSGAVGVHLICVPNEKEGRPCDEALLEVIQALAGEAASQPEAPALWVIESSGEPGVIDRIVLPVLQRHGLTVGEDVCICAAPRLDYGRSPFDRQARPPRVVGGVTRRCNQLSEAFYRFLGQNVCVAGSPLKAELACAIHRGAQHLLMGFSNQLALAFGDTDIREVMGLAGRLGPVSLEAPGLGSTGYFLPVSPNHVRSSALDPEMLTLLEEAFRCDLMMGGVVADRLADAGVQHVGILGLSSEANTKNHIHSSALKLIRALRGRVDQITVCDPLYSAAELEAISGCSAGHWPDGLTECDGIVLVGGHHAFQTLPARALAEHLHGAKLVLDCAGAWTDLKLDRAGIRYFALGQPGWAG